MQLSVKGKQIDVGDALRAHVEDKLNEIVGKYFGDSLDATITFSRQAHLFRADILVHAGRGIDLQSNADAPEIYPAFDQAAARLAERLRRHKNRLRRHHQSGAVEHEQAVMAQAFVLTPQDDEAAAADDIAHPVIVAEMTTPIEMLTVGEAVMKMDLADLPALMFRNRAHGKLNMIYRRADGNIGWVDPSSQSKKG